MPIVQEIAEKERDRNRKGECRLKIDRDRDRKAGDHGDHQRCHCDVRHAQRPERDFADLQHDPRDILSLIQPILADEADLVYGDRS